MSRPKATVPSYCLHRLSGQGYARFGPTIIYFGSHDGPATKRRYETKLTEWQANGWRLRVALLRWASRSLVAERLEPVEPVCEFPAECWVTRENSNGWVPTSVTKPCEVDTGELTLPGLAADGGQRS